MKTIAMLEAENAELTKKTSTMEARAIQAESALAAVNAEKATLAASVEANTKAIEEAKAKANAEALKAEEAQKAKLAAEEAAKAANMKLVESIAANTSPAVPKSDEDDSDLLSKFNAITDNRERGEFYAKHRAKLIK